MSANQMRFFSSFFLLACLLISQSIVNASVLTDTLIIRIHAGWNLLSVPVHSDEQLINQLFVTASSPGYVYRSGYVRIDSLPLTGEGFWLKCTAADTVTLIGTKLFEQTFTLQKGWNLLGSHHRRIAVANLASSLSKDSLLSSPFYGFHPDSGYYAVDTLEAGAGYWVKAQQAGTITSSDWEFMGLDGERISAMAIHPTNPDILYAGSLYDFSAGHYGKLFKSSDGGLSWDTLLYSGDFKQLIIDPLHPETLYAATGTIIKSTNGGQTWARCDSGITLDAETFLWSIGIRPGGTGDTLFAGTGGFFGGKFYRSTNGGLSWHDRTTHSSLQFGANAIAIDPVNPNIMYAGTSFNGTLLRSVNGGSS